jgi:hypothetical protein
MVQRAAKPKSHWSSWGVSLPRRARITAPARQQPRATTNARVVFRDGANRVKLDSVNESVTASYYVISSFRISIGKWRGYRKGKQHPCPTGYSSLAVARPSAGGWSRSAPERNHFGYGRMRFAGHRRAAQRFAQQSAENYHGRDVNSSNNSQCQRHGKALPRGRFGGETSQRQTSAIHSALANARVRKTG